MKSARGRWAKSLKRFSGGSKDTLAAQQRICAGWSKCDAAADSLVATMIWGHIFYCYLLRSMCEILRVIPFLFIKENRFQNVDCIKNSAPLWHMWQTSLSVSKPVTVTSHFDTTHLMTASFLGENERMKHIHPSYPHRPRFAFCPATAKGTAAKQINLASRTGSLAALNRMGTGISKDSTSLLWCEWMTRQRRHGESDLWRAAQRITDAEENERTCIMFSIWRWNYHLSHKSISHTHTREAKLDPNMRKNLSRSFRVPLKCHVRETKCEI